MLPVKLTHIETDNPEKQWSQDAILEHLLRTKKISSREQIFYKRFLSDGSIATRHFGLKTLDQTYDETADEAIQRFERVATQIGSQALKKCLARAGKTPVEIDGLVVTTCTGYLCPGLTSYIAQASGLRDDLFTLDLAGTGCGAALPALRSAVQFLNTHPDSNIMVLCVEVCSAALAWGQEIDLILSNAIFADGAAACLLSNKPEAKGLEVLNFASLLWPEYRDDLRFKHRDARLCNVINKNVPEIAAEAVKQLRQNLAEKVKEPFRYHAIHPGGRRILDEIENALELDVNALQSSRAVLKQYGNMSSPSILYVIKKIWEDEGIENGDHLLVFSFGAGFTAFGAALKGVL
ncbi:MAG: hypothetical protein H6757_01965 [Candidatus Omnitrophica bacterium]|nr:hypothetical protein [Candidatus Omnitrophota bacterium]